MIVCPNCNHQNPDGAVQCEACYTPLPAMVKCPSCGASVQADASFCGQCGFNLSASPAAVPATMSPDLDIPDLPPIEPLVQPEPLLAQPSAAPAVGADSPSSEPIAPPDPTPPNPTPPGPIAPPEPPPLPVPPPAVAVPVPPAPSQTQLQTQSARLLHVQTNTTIELPGHVSVIHLGKPNDRIPPDVDVSGFPNSEIVSRIHADIRVEADAYYIEDVGSSNGTYINNSPLPPGNRHRLRPGDRIALGKGDKVSFLFQLS